MGWGSGSTGLFIVTSFASPLSPAPASLATVGSHREGRLRGGPCSEIAQRHCQQEETQEAEFWSCRGRPVGVLSTKGTGRKRREEQSKKKIAQDTKDGESPHPTPKRRRSLLLCARVENRRLSDQSPGAPPLPASHSLHLVSGGPQVSPSQAVL